MKKFDRFALSAILISAALLLAVILLGNLLPVRITLDLDQDQPISQRAGIAFKFSRSVDPQNVEALWQTEPQIEGWWQWADERHATWHASTALPITEDLKLSFSAGTMGNNGERLKKEKTWTLKVRQPRILVLKYTGEEGQELFSVGLEEGAVPLQLTDTAGRLLDYAPAPDGEEIIFSASNDSYGADLWTVARDGSEERLLLDCGSDRCSTAAWSPVSHEVAYTRETAGSEPDSAKGAPRIWMLDLDSLETAPLFESDQTIGYDSKWSPDGQWLSIWDSVNENVIVVNRKSGETFLLESSSGDIGCWSMDSKSLYYADLIVGQSSFHSVVLKANIVKGTVETILGGNIEGEGMSYDNPECHPSENILAASIQPNVKIPGKLLSLFNLDTSEETEVMNDMTKFGHYYAWNPGGEYFLFQMSAVSHHEEDYEIWVRDTGSGQTRLVLSCARSPSWLP